MTIQFDKYRKYGAYHWGWYVDKPRYTQHVDRVKDWIKERNVLDIGAGDGLITSKIGGKGIDNDEVAVKLAQERNVDVILADAYNLPFKENEFDAVYIGDTLEHLEFPVTALQEARRVLKKYLYIAGPCPGGILEAYEYEASKWDTVELKNNVEKLGFILEGDILEIGRRKRMWFYAKFKKV